MAQPQGTGCAGESCGVLTCPEHLWVVSVHLSVTAVEAESLALLGVAVVPVSRALGDGAPDPLIQACNAEAVARKCWPETGDLVLYLEARREVPAEFRSRLLSVEDAASAGLLGRKEETAWWPTVGDEPAGSPGCLLLIRTAAGLASYNAERSRRAALAAPPSAPA